VLADPEARPLKISRMNDKDVAIDVHGITPDAADTVVVLEFTDRIATDAARLLADHEQSNVLRAFDAQRVGSGLRYGDGKAPKAYVMDWTRPEQELRWKVRVNQPTRFTVAVRYTTGTPKDGGTYVVEGGTQKVEGKVEAAAKDGDSKTAELGQILIAPGETDLVIKPEKIGGAELMRIYDVTLIPVAQ
jgi:hypothetical protein